VINIDKMHGATMCSLGLLLHGNEKTDRAAAGKAVGDGIDALASAAALNAAGKVQLTAAIRAFTVDAPDDQPNGERERQLDSLGHALERGDVRAARKAYSLMCAAGADDLKALRVAAEMHFGGDFKTKAPT